MGRLNRAIEVDVSDAVPLPGRHVVRGRMLASTAPTQPFVWCCLPGGRCTSGYFDLAVDGDTSYSMVVNLGSGGDGLPQYLRNPDWATAEISTVRASMADLARAVQLRGGPPAAGPAAVRRAFARQMTNLIPAFSDRSWALSDSECCPVGGPERSWVTWSGGWPHEAVAVFRHGRGCRLGLAGSAFPAHASGTGALRG